MNPITNAITDIHNEIPYQILQVVFGNEDIRQWQEGRRWRRDAPVSIDEMIRSKVIRPTVLKDLNLIGGRNAIVFLDGLGAYPDQDFTTIFEIPLERTGNREIMSVLNIGYTPVDSLVAGGGAAYAAISPMGMTDTLMASQRVMESHGSMPHISTAECELIGYNTVLVRDRMRQTTSYTLTCILSNEEELSNISIRSYPNVSEACVLATKAYIYNHQVITMDQGRLEQGQNLGEYKRIIDEYAEARKEYKEYLRTVMRKVLFMNDVRSYKDFISSQIHPGL